MATTRVVQKLLGVARTFGQAPAHAKVQSLAALASLERLPSPSLRSLHDAALFLSAYPDNRRVLTGSLRILEMLRARGTSRRDSGMPGAVHVFEYAFPTLERLRRLFPSSLAVDWDSLEDDIPLQNTLGLLVTTPEWLGLDDISMTMTEWIERCRHPSQPSDLAFLLDLFAGSRFLATEKEYLWESCAVPVRYTLNANGTARGEIRWPTQRTHYQRHAPPRERFSLAGAIGRPFAAAQVVRRAAGERFIDLAVATLCARNLEIRSLMYANPRDVWLLECGRELLIGLIGVVPEYRDPLESSYCCLILKNGVPIAYGPASVCFGCCELGLNLFPEFRGVETRRIYAQFMRAIHQVLGARYFYLTEYGMGVGNPAAIRSGSFWFYRKLGFQPTNPAVETIAQEEEERMRKEPGYRCSTRTLHRLSATEVFFDLSHGECRRIALGAIGVRVARWIADRFGGDRRRAEEQGIEDAARHLKIENVHQLPKDHVRALRTLAPILCLLPGVEAWSSRDRQRMRRLVAVKGGRSEARADRLLQEHATFQAGLRKLCS